MAINRATQGLRNFFRLHEVLSGPMKSATPFFTLHVSAVSDTLARRNGSGDRTNPTPSSSSSGVWFRACRSAARFYSWLQRYRHPVSHGGGCGSHVRQPSGALGRHLLQPGAARHSGIKMKRAQVVSPGPSTPKGRSVKQGCATSLHMPIAFVNRRRPAIQDVARSHVTCGVPTNKCEQV